MIHYRLFRSLNSYLTVASSSLKISISMTSSMLPETRVAISIAKGNIETQALMVWWNAWAKTKNSSKDELRAALKITDLFQRVALLYHTVTITPRSCRAICKDQISNIKSNQVEETEEVYPAVSLVLWGASVAQIKMMYLREATTRKIIRSNRAKRWGTVINQIETILRKLVFLLLK